MLEAILGAAMPAAEGAQLAALGGTFLSDDGSV